MNKKRLGALCRYVFSYMLIFAIPFIVLGFMVYQNAVVNLKNAVESSNFNKLEQVKDVLDAYLNEMQVKAAEIAYDPRLMPFTIKSGGYYSKEAVEELARYKSSSAFIEEIFLYFRDDDRVYSSAGSNSINTLLQYVYNYRSWKKRRVLSRY